MKQKAAKRGRSSWWTWETLRYRGSGWWVDAILPHSPIGLLATALTIPALWFAVGYAITDDRDAFLTTPDVSGQVWFFPLHVIALRVVGGLWGAGLAPALDGLAFDDAAQHRVRRGALGRWASVGAFAACAFFIVRDVWFGFAPDPDTGLIPFDDPEMWGMAAIGRSVHFMMLALWSVEWLMFGYLLWLQLWILVSWTRQLGKVELGDKLGDVLAGNGYRHSFRLFSRTTTVSLVFAVGNLGFIAFTGELFPREVVEIESVGDFLREMSDLLAITLLFVFALVAVFAFVRALRTALTGAVNARFAEAGDLALAELETPLASSGDVPTDVERIRARLDAQAGLLRAVIYQREVDVVGNRTMATMLAKALLPLATTIAKLSKVLGL